MTNAEVKEPTFDELWNQEEGAAASVAVTETPVPGAEQTAAATEQEEAEHHAAATGTEAQAAAGTEAAGTEAAAATAGAATTEKTEDGKAPTYPDWIADLPEDKQKAAKATLDAERQKYAALHGRLAPVQRALSDAQQRLATQTKPAPAAQSSVPAKQATQDQQTTSTADSFFDSAEWKQYAEDFPGDAKVLRAGLERQERSAAERMQQLERRLDQLGGRVSEVGQVADRTKLAEQTTALESEHPDWREHNNSDDFWNWFDAYRAAQPEEVRGAYYDPAILGKWFQDAGFLSRVLTSYKRETGIAASAASTSSTQQQEAVQRTDVDATQQQTQTSAADVKLRMGATQQVRGGSQPATRGANTAGMSEAEQFDHLFNLPD